jgi:hypothetical protein
MYLSVQPFSTYLFKSFFTLELTISKVFKQYLQPGKMQMKKNIRIFISYSHKDESYKDELTTHLAGLKRAGYIESWDDRKILPGQQWNDEIANSLNNANLILFLLSADFIASEYVYKVEIQAAKEKHKRQEATIVPIIIRGCDFPNSSLSNYQALPKNGQAINFRNK